MNIGLSQCLVLFQWNKLSVCSFHCSLSASRSQFGQHTQHTDGSPLLNSLRSVMYLLINRVRLVRPHAHTPAYLISTFYLPSTMTATTPRLSQWLRSRLSYCRRAVHLRGFLYHIVFPEMSNTSPGIVRSDNVCNATAIQPEPYQSMALL